MSNMHFINIFLTYGAGGLIGLSKKERDLDLNGKKARRLRQKAYNATKGMVNTAYTKDPETGAIVLIANCTRAVYKKLKREYKEKRNHR